VARPSDLHGAGMVASALHQRYQPVSDEKEGLVATLLGHFERPADAETDAEFSEASWATKRRSSMRFLVELFVIGVMPSLDPLVDVLKRMMKEDDATRDFSNLSLIREFAKVAALDILGTRARDASVELAALESVLEAQDEPVISPEGRADLCKLFKAYHARVSQRLCNVHKKMRAQEKRNYETEMMKGTLSEVRQQEFKEIAEEHGKLSSNLKTMSDVLDIDMPELPEDEEEEEVVGRYAHGGQVASAVGVLVETAGSFVKRNG
jgi:hypothetical protein